MKRAKITPDKFPYIAAVAQAALYIHAFVVYIGPAWGAVIGSCLGVVVSLCAAYGASRVAETSAKRRTMSYIGFIALMVISPVVVAPSLFYSLRADILADLLPARWILCAVIALAPDGAIMLAGAITGRGMFGAMQTEAAQAAVQVPAKRTAKPDKRRKCEQCGEVVASPAAYSAHVRWKHPKPVPVDAVFLKKM